MIIEKLAQDKQKLSEDINDLIWEFLRTYGSNITDMNISNDYNKTVDGRYASVCTEVKITI